MKNKQFISNGAFERKPVTHVSQTSARPAREWLKYAATFLLIFTLGIGNVWGAVTYQSYEDNVLDTSTEIGSSNVSSGTAGKISWTGNNCTWASTRLNIAANGYITFTASSGNNITKIVIYSASANYYGTWTSDPSGTVNVSGGTSTITGLNANSVRITTSTAFRATPGANTYIKVYYTAADDGCGVFHETFNSCNKDGGNDDTWSGISTTGTIAVDNAGWTFVQGNAASKCARFGTGSNKGSAETPAIAYTGSKNLILTFKAGAWNGGSEQTTLNLSATNATLDKSSVTMTKGEWDEFTVTLSSVSNNFKVKWEGKQASNSRFFLDEICIAEEEASGYTLVILDAVSIILLKPFITGFLHIFQ